MWGDYCQNNYNVNSPKSFFVFSIAIIALFYFRNPEEG